MDHSEWLIKYWKIVFRKSTLEVGMYLEIELNWAIGRTFLIYYCIKVCYVVLIDSLTNLKFV